MQDKIYANLKVEKLPESEASIIGEITVEALSTFRTEAIKHFQGELELPGFRKGHVPEKMVLEKIGELGILEEAGEEAIKKAFPEIMREAKMDTIGLPQIAITKLAIGAPLEFKITIAIAPEFTLPDYKKISKAATLKAEDILVTEKEIEEAVLQIRKMRAQSATSKNVADEAPHLQASEGSINLPPLTDEIAKTFGKFEGIEDFKTKMRESLKKEKEFRQKEKIRLEIIKEIIEKTEIPLPRVLIEAELERMLGQMKDDVERMGLKHGEYLKRINKTETDLKKEWEKDAIERAKMELILGRIAEVEKITASDDEIQKEITHILEHYKDADPIRAASYFRHIITNEKVFQFLEEQK